MTGDWGAGGEAGAGGGNVEGGSDEEVFGDFEDLQTGYGGVFCVASLWSVFFGLYLCLCYVVTWE